MKKDYTDPTFDLIRITLTDSLLTTSINDFNPEGNIGEDVVDDDP